MLKDITSAEPLEGYRLQLSIEDGVDGQIDLSTILHFADVFAPLREHHFFMQVRVNPDLGTICWPNGADVDPDVPYFLVTGESLPTFTHKRGSSRVSSVRHVSPDVGERQMDGRVSGGGAFPQFSTTNASTRRVGADAPRRWRGFGSRIRGSSSRCWRRGRSRADSAAATNDRSLASVAASRSDATDRGR
jgi:hypothetical protein